MRRKLDLWKQHQRSVFKNVMLLVHTIVPSFPLLFSEEPSVWDKAIEISTAFQLVLQEFFHPGPERLWLIPSPGKEKKNHNKTTTCIVLILHLTHIYLHAEMSKCYLTLYTCGLKWPHFQTKQCISKIHHYSLVPKTSNKVISATLCDKTRMEKTFYDLWESQQTQSSHRKM